MSQKSKLDQYYTNPKIAEYYTNLFKQIVKEDKRRAIIEPSAGTGVFLNKFQNTYAFDLDPKSPGIIKKDFLTVTTQDIDNRERCRVSVLGNPPFGFAGSLAIKFFNHATTIANTIGFILPKSFKKQSTQNKLNKKYHLIFEKDVPKNSFILNEKCYDVPCVFQIWERKLASQKRQIMIPVTNKFKFIAKSEADNTCFCIRRVGGKSGQVLKGLDHSKSSTYWIKPLCPFLQKICKKIDFNKIVNNTAGVRSLSKLELVMEVEKYYAKN